MVEKDSAGASPVNDEVAAGDQSSEGASPFTMQVESPQPWQRVIKVEVSRDHFEQEYGKRLTVARRDHRRPGFRKGKTPRAMVERELGDHLRAQTLEALVPVVYKAAIIEHKVAPITDPVIENLVFEDDKPLTFDLVVEVRPEVEAKGFDNLPVQERAVAVADNEIDAVIERLREARGIWERVDRAAVDGDQITLDLVQLDGDGEPDPDKLVEDQKFVLGAPQNLTQFNETLAGAEASQEHDIAIDYPHDYPNEELRGQAVTFRCTVKEVGHRVLPEADDAFAGQLEEGQTLLGLRGDIRNSLEKEASDRVSREMDEQLVSGLVARNEVAVPPSLVEDYLKSGVEELHSRNLQSNRTSTDEEDEQYRELTRPIAEQVLKGMFILDAIRRQEEITVSDEEVEARVVEIAAENGFDLEKYREYLAKGTELDKIRHGLEERKTYDFLLSRAAVTQVAADAVIGEDVPADTAELQQRDAKAGD